MPPNLGNTMFARWYNQQMADAASRRQAVADQRDDGRFQAEMLEAGAKQQALRDEQSRKDLETSAALAGQQSEELGQPMPEVSDPGMQLAMREGSQGSVLSRLAEARKARASESTARLKHSQDLELEAMRGRNRIAAAKSRGPASVVNVGAQGQPGGIPLTVPQQTKVQDEIRQAQRRNAQLDLIDNAAVGAGGHEQASSWTQRGTAVGAEFAEAAAPGYVGGASEAASRQAAYDGALATFSNQILNDLSGAAINEHEWERLKKSLPTISDSGATKRAKMAAWRANNALIERMGVDALVNGIVTGSMRIDNSGRISAAGAGQPPPQRSPADAPTGGKVRVIMPDGQTGMVGGDINAFLAENPGAQVVR